MRTEQRRFNVMTTARNQPFNKNYNINVGCFEGTRISPRNITQRNTTLKIHETHLCLIWKSDGISFDKTIKEIKDNFKVVHNIISDKPDESFVKYEYNPK